MSVYVIKDKHIVFQDGFKSTCPIVPALAIPVISKAQDSKEQKGNVPFDKVRFPCTLTCRLLETDVVENSQGETKMRMRTNCIPNPHWDYYTIEEPVISDVEPMKADEPEGKTVKLNSKRDG